MGGRLGDGSTPLNRPVMIIDLSKKNSVDAIDFQRPDIDEKRNARERQRRRRLVVQKSEAHGANTETTFIISSADNIADTETRESFKREKSYDFPPWSDIVNCSALGPKQGLSNHNDETSQHLLQTELFAGG